MIFLQVKLVTSNHSSLGQRSMDGGAGSQDEFGDEMGMGDGTDHGGGKSAADHAADTPATGPTLVEQVLITF